ncbi:MAG: TlyA family RNA methyltransferase [Acidobacteria bacterium]|nr:MAG: TlyA family RNA methyltransferase [Acidobacteriota bacterium]REK10162.1 MAG: TlyA family RNA methyltransferase [Acidobacteriota bacterium]
MSAAAGHQRPGGRAGGRRLDVVLTESGHFASREKARRAVMAGEVLVDGQVLDKPGLPVPEGAAIEVRQRPPFVSRGGLKLAQALDAFAIDPRDRTCIDVGASTGGFTDCLLQRGARRVYAVDVGYGQLDASLRSDPRVVVLERVNARAIGRSQVPEACSLAVLDVSFISLHKVLPAVISLLEPSADVVPLIKPQFEGERRQVGKGGVVRDPEVRLEILAEVERRLQALGLDLVRRIDCDTPGAKGNREALAHLRLRPGAPAAAAPGSAP